MPPKGGGGGGDKSKQFFDGIRTQKQDAIRWCLNYGGISSATRDDDGYTGLHMAAMLGKPRSLEAILDHIRRAHMSRGGGDIRAPKTDRRRKPCAELEERDEDKGMTALMHACNKGAFECVKLLHECHCSWDAKSDQKLSAHDYAKKSGKEDILAWIARGYESEEEAEEDDGIEEIEGETATERRKRIKALKSGKEKHAFAAKAVEKEDSSDDEKEADIGPGPEPKWDEIIAQRQSGQADLAISRLGDEKEVDPALWYCKQVNNLKLRMPPGVLTSLPSELANLKSLTTLIVSNNSLKEFPSEILKLEHLKNLEFADNQVECFPDDMDDLENLEVIDAARNKLTSTEPLKGLCNLVTLKLDQNKIKGLSLAYKKLTRLQTLSASHNEISSLDDKMGRLGALMSLNLSNNNIKELPTELSNLSEKVLHHLNLDDNPIKDSKVKKILEKGRAPIKELIAHLEKEGKSGKSKKGKKKAASEDEDDDEEEEEEEVEEPEPEPVPVPVAAAPAPSGGGGGGGGGKNKKKGKGGKGGGPQLTEAQKEAARAEAMRKLGMPVPAPKAAAPAAAPAAPAPAAPPANEKMEEDEAEADFEAGEEADDDDLDAFMCESEPEDSDDDLDDFLSDKPKESDADREARIKKELEARNKGAIALQKEQEKKKKEHEEWLASMDDEMRAMYIADIERKKRAAEEEARAAENERDMRRQEEMRRKAGGSASAPAPAAASKGGNDRTESKWSYSGDKLVKELLERKGPKKTVREIQLLIPNRKIGLIIGKAGVNIKIIEAKSAAKVKIFKAAPDADETLVTVKGSPENVDRACDTINLVFEQAKKHRAAAKAAK